MKFNYVRIAVLFVLLVSVGIFTTSCSSFGGGDDNPQVAAFVGDWKLVNVYFTGEKPDPSEYEGFSIALNSAGTYALTNPTDFYSPTNNSGTYTSTNSFIMFDTGAEVNLTQLTGNTMTWEWQVSQPGKVTATYRYIFERM